MDPLYSKRCRTSTEKVDKYYSYLALDESEDFVLNSKCMMGFTETASVCPNNQASQCKCGQSAPSCSRSGFFLSFELLRSRLVALAVSMMASWDHHSSLSL